MEKRSYRLKKRAQQQEDTRHRIVEATAALHAEMGPSATTISAVAERAGVQRLTVYRHFPDEAGLFAACAEHTAAQHPPPDPALWREIADPAERSEAALRALYAYYAGREQALAHVLRDAEQIPALHDALAPMRGYVEGVAAALAGGWPIAPGAERRFGAALAHALEFWTWRSLAGQGLHAEEAAHLMTRFVSAATGIDA